ncbi:MAG: hypothetical protein LQ340_007854, partial [Diploschistes diacapsis]
DGNANYGSRTKLPELGLFWAPEDEALVGGVVDGLLDLCAKIVRGDEGGAGRRALERASAVIIEGGGKM